MDQILIGGRQQIRHHDVAAIDRAGHGPLFTIGQEVVLAALCTVRADEVAGAHTLAVTVAHALAGARHVLVARDVAPPAEPARQARRAP